MKERRSGEDSMSAVLTFRKCELPHLILLEWPEAQQWVEGHGLLI